MQQTLLICLSLTVYLLMCWVLWKNLKNANMYCVVLVIYILLNYIDYKIAYNRGYYDGTKSTKTINAEK